ncbi:hypothetical protein [Streptomyces sp. NPDC047315]
MVQNFLVRSPWGGTSVKRPSGEPYCQGCTPEEIAQYKRDHGIES